MKAEEVLAKLEQHGAECNMRYERIEEQLQEQRITLDKLDKRLWGLAVLIVAAAVAEQLVYWLWDVAVCPSRFQGLRKRKSGVLKESGL